MVKLLNLLANQHGLPQIKELITIQTNTILQEKRIIFVKA